MTQNLHVCTICFRLKVVYGVVSGRNVKTIEGYLVANFEVSLALTVSEILKKNHFVTAAEANIDDSIKRKRIRVSLKNMIQTNLLQRPTALAFEQHFDAPCTTTMSD